MLYLTTGTPGAGKTLHTIWTVNRRAQAESRPVYQYNVRGLTLPWIELTKDQVLKWFDFVPDGSIIFIDEAQDIFPARGTGQKVPDHVEWIAKHRHRGLDIYLVTQHPMKLDSNVRKDVEEHRHLMRKFGTHWSTVHLWKGCRDNCDKSRKDSISHQWRYPKEVFDFYKSAEIHTVRVTVPWKIYALLGLVLVGVALAWWIFYGREKYRAGPPAAAVPVAGPAGGNVPIGGPQPGVRASTPTELYRSLQPRVVGMPHTAPRYDELTKPVRAPVVVGCWLSDSDGWCITQQATRLRLPREVMKAYIENGQFVDFDPGPNIGDQRQQNDQHAPRQNTQPARLPVASSS